MRLVNLSYTKNGNALLTVEMSRDTAELWMDEFQNKDVDVTIKEHKNKRSLDANAYAWTLLGKLAEKTVIGKTTIYRHFIREIGDYTTVCVKYQAVSELVSAWESHGLGWLTESFPSKIPGCTNVQLYYGSSTYDTAQMSRLIDMIIQDCKEQGIPTETPEQIAEMISKWGEKVK